MVQHRAARFVTNNYNYHPSSMTSILHSLHWSTVETRRTVNRLIVFHKIIYHQVATEIPQHYLGLVNNRKTRHSHSVNIMQPQCNTKAYEFSFYPRTIRDWNKLPRDTNVLLQTPTRAPSREISGHTSTPRPEIRRCCR